MIGLRVRLLRGRVVLEFDGIPHVICRFQECPRCGAPCLAGG